MPDIWRLGRVRDAKLDTNVYNEKLLHHAKCQAYDFQRFWVVKGKPTVGKIKRLGVKKESHWYFRGFCEIFGNTFLAKHFRSSPPEVFLGKDVPKICSKFTEHPCQSKIPMGSPVNLLHILRTSFPKITSEGLLLTFWGNFFCHEVGRSQGFIFFCYILNKLNHY